MPRGWFSGPGIGVLNGIFLRLDCINDPVTAGLEINAATAGEPVLTLLTTDDNITNPYLDLNNSGTPMPYIMEKDGARFLHTYGMQNLFGGLNAGNFTLTGQQNLALGEIALNALTTGSWNTAISIGSLQLLQDGERNVGLGRGTLASSVSDSRNMAIGDLCLTTCNGGDQNVGVGYVAMGELTTGDSNFGLGTFALRYNQTGGGNVCIGTSAGRGSVGNSHTENIFIGGSAGISIQTGGYNVGIGSGVMGALRTGQYNVAVGRLALAACIAGSENTVIGEAAGNRLTGSGNVIIGRRAALNQVAISNRLFIHNAATATPLIYGEFDTWRLAFGNQYTVDKYGELAHASGYFAAIGDAQASPDSFIVRRAVASHVLNTWYPLYPDGGTTPERLTIAADSAWMVDVLVIGLTQNAAQQWAYQIIGVLERDNANNTTLAVQTVVAHFESDAFYEVQLVADDANEALEVQVRRIAGSADYDIRWVATIRHVQAGYP